MQIVFLGQFVRQDKAAYERDYLAIGVLKLWHDYKNTGLSYAIPA